MNRRGSTSRVVVVLLALLGTGTIVGALLTRKPDAATLVVTKNAAPATTQANSTTLAATTKPLVLRQYLDVVLANAPDFPTTQPLSTPVGLNDAALIEITVPLYLDLRHEMWITRPEAEETTEVIKRASKQSTHVVRDPVKYIHYGRDAKGTLRPNLVTAKVGGGYELVSLTMRKRLGDRDDYLWDRAFSLPETMVVPTITGVSVFSFGDAGTEQHIELVSRPPGDVKLPEPVVLQDPRGIIAWIPWDNTEPGGDVVARYLDGAWKPFPKESGLPPRVIYIVPLLDGTYLTLSLGERNLAHLTRTIIDSPKIDESSLVQLTIPER